METIPLLKEGHEILAVDISSRMLEVVREKAKAEGLSERLRVWKGRARDLGKVVDDYGSHAFDGGYSTYGALNCEPNLDFLPGTVATLLRRNAAFVAGVYNRWCLFEMLGYATTFQWRRAFGRRKNPVLVGTSRFCVDVYAYSVADFVALFGRPWRVIRVEAVPIILPPSDLTNYAEKFARHFERLAGWDGFLGRHWPWGFLGDHFLLTAISTGDFPRVTTPQSGSERSAGSRSESESPLSVGNTR
jgi:SAM-dependent methyltransferase